MKIAFTKMQGAGNDFVVLDETRGLLGLSSAQLRFLADRHFGIGADQVLSVRPAPSPAIDFEYVIYNSDGGEVEQCGNGARCFVRYVRDKGLTTRDEVRVQTRSGVIAPRIDADGRVTVDMGPPVFDPARVPFDTAGITAHPIGGWQTWPLALGTHAHDAIVPVAVLSMGNPHAVQLVDDLDSAAVALHGPRIEHHPRFAQRVNAGFLQVIDRRHAALRVHERGAGETLACGTGACAAVVAGIRLGVLDAGVPIDVDTRGGRLTITWAGLQGSGGGADNHSGGGPAVPHVFLTGPAITVFEGQIEIPDHP